MQFHNSEQLTPKWTAQKLTHFTGYRDYSSGIAKTTSHIFFKQLHSHVRSCNAYRLLYKKMLLMWICCLHFVDCIMNLQH